MTTTTPALALAVTLATTLSALGCTRTVRHASRFHVTLDATPESDRAASCFRTCFYGHEGDADATAACLRRCPGVDGESGTCRMVAEDRPPEAMCFAYDHEEVVSDGQTLGARAFVQGMRAVGRSLGGRN